jgi:cob(I)alamin adenosyltransferase
MGVMPPTKRVDILKDRNEKLSAQLTVQRGEMNRLQRRVTELEEQENARRETLLCVNRLWEELNDSLSFLSFR